MSQCQGVNIYASGDYLLDERQGYLCTTIERLRAHMVTLKEKLEEEKAMLSELKAETHYLTMQRSENTRVLEDYHHNRCQSERSVGLSSPYDGGTTKAKKLVEEPKHNFDRVEYVQRLKEIDNLCKEEMARMNSVVEQMEPLKQMASDWMLETRLKEVGGTPLLKDNAAGTQPHRSIDITGYDHPSYTAELIVIPPKRPEPSTPAFQSEPQPESAFIETQLTKSSKSQIDWETKKEPELEQLELDCLLLNRPQNNISSGTERRGSSAKGKKKPKDSSSEVSLSSLEALKEQNITLIDVADDNAGKRNVNLETKCEDKKSTGSRKTSKSAISLESIQRAFAKHHKKKRKEKRTEKKTATDVPSALNILDMFGKRRDNMSLEKNMSEEEQRKLFSFLHPSAKKIVKNWVMIGAEEKKVKTPPKKKRERVKRCTLNLGRNEDTELSLCEDDVINKFLYDEEGYVYTPLFISETGDECSSDSLSEN